MLATVRAAVWRDEKEVQLRSKTKAEKNLMGTRKSFQHFTTSPLYIRYVLQVIYLGQ